MSITAREPIEVLALFKANKLRPLQFTWGKRTYIIKTIDLVFSERKGRDKITYYAVHDGTNSFRLAYSTEAQHWDIETEETLL